MLFSASSLSTMQMNDKQKTKKRGLVTNDEYLALEEEH